MNKTVLITGCSSGFGRAICKDFKDQGNYVTATVRNAIKLADARAELKEWAVRRFY